LNYQVLRGQVITSRFEYLRGYTLILNERHLMRNRKIIPFVYSLGVPFNL